MQEPIIKKLTEGFPTPPYKNYAEKSEWVKYAALYLLGIQVLDSLELVHLTDMEPHGPAIPVQMCDGGGVVRNHTLFSWTLKDYLDRREQAATWMTALEKSVTPKCLEEQKHAADFRQLTRFVKLTFQCYLQHVDESEFNLISFFTKCKAATNVQIKLDSDLQKNTKKQKKAAYFRYALMLLWHLTHKSASTNQEPVFELMDTNILYAMSNRYLLEYNEAFVVTEEIGKTRKLDEISKEIERYKAKLASDQFCSLNVMDIYSNEIKQLKNRITIIDNEYENKMEELEGSANYIRLFIERDRDLVQYYEDQILFFREDMENVRIRMSTRAKRKAAQEAREAARIKKEAKKKDKKKGGKKEKKEKPQKMVAQKKKGKTT